MFKIGVVWIISFIVLSAEDFISHYEYGQMLYSNPRGVSCALCHGVTGKGKIIAFYKNDNNTKVDIVSPDITKISLKQMISALNSDHNIMPKYYLTDKEVKAIYDYIQKSQ